MKYYYILPRLLKGHLYHLTKSSQKVGMIIHVGISRCIYIDINLHVFTHYVNICSIAMWGFTSFTRSTWLTHHSWIDALKIDSYLLYGNQAMINTDGNQCLCVLLFSHLQHSNLSLKGIWISKSRTMEPSAGVFTSYFGKISVSAILLNWLDSSC